MSASEKWGAGLFLPASHSASMFDPSAPLVSETVLSWDWISATTVSFAQSLVSQQSRRSYYRIHQRCACPHKSMESELSFVRPQAHILAAYSGH